MVKIAQIGCGHWGKNLARNFFEIGNLAAVVDDNPEVAKRMSDEFDVPVLGFDEVLADLSIEAIALATPAELHAEQAARAIEAGKHCYVEKPLALNVADAEKLIALAAKHDRRLMVGHLLQYHPVFIACLKMVRDGVIGNVRYLYSNRMSLGKFRTEENVLWSFAPHDISMVLSIAGEEPDFVTAQGMAHVTSGVADWCTTQMQFSSGITAHVQVSWLHPFKEQRLVVIGDEGALVFEDSQPAWENKLALYPYTIDRSNAAAAPTPAKGEVMFPTVAKGEPLQNECRHFVEAIEGGFEPRSGGREGLAVLRVLATAEKALSDSLASKQ